MMTQLVGQALLAGAALLCASATPAQSAADSDALSDVLACADLDREILRLECYDDAVAGIRSRAESPRGAASNDRPSSGAASPDAAARAATANDTPAAARAGGPRTSPPDTTSGVDSGASSRSPASSPNDERDSGGDEDGDRQVTIVEVLTAIPGRAVFVTSDGEQFVQTSGRLRLYLPDVPFVANVRSSAVGGTFLTPEGTRRSIRIAERD